MKISKQKHLLILTIFLLAAAGWKAWLVWKDVIPFNSDEAIVALMARHILLGERPVFFYGQVYMGSLDAFLAALGFFIFGQHVWVIRLIQTILYLGTIITTVAIGVVGFRSWKTCLIAGAMLALPAVNTTLYTTASLGGYGEALLIGNLTLLLGIILFRKIEGEPGRFFGKGTFLQVFLLGLLVGLGVWANGLTLIYSAPVGLLLLWAAARQWKKINHQQVFMFLGAAVFGGMLGAAPWWAYLIQQGGVTLVEELFGNAVAVEKDPWIVQVFNHLVSLVLLGMTALFGFRPPWKVEWLGIPLLPFILIFWGWVVWQFFGKRTKEQRSEPTFILLTGVCLALIAGFLFTPFGVDPSGRYFVPLAVVLALAAGWVLDTVLDKQWMQIGIVSLVLVYHAWGTLQCVQDFPPGLTTQFDAVTAIDHQYDQELVNFLEEQDEIRGYTNYWVAYPLAFLSQEDLIFVPRLPYHQDMRYTPRDDRYEPYTQIVAESEKIAYITTNHPILNEMLRERFESKGVTWLEKQIGDYRVFYSLSSPIKVNEIGLGVYTP